MADFISFLPVSMWFVILLVMLLVVLLILSVGYRQVKIQHNTLFNELHYLREANSQQTMLLNNLLQSYQYNQNDLEQKIGDLKIKLMRQQYEQSEKLQVNQQNFSQEVSKLLHNHQQNFSANQLKSVDQLIEHLTLTTKTNREELTKSLNNTSESLAQGIKQLTESTDKRLKEISNEVEKRLAEGFDKTTKTFNDIVKRLALIDDAQKKITELSSNVVSLQEVLSDKRSRGAFGEVQLNALIRNVLPEQHFSLQHTLSNGKVADCVVFLPEPTGNIVIDSKFPLESYRVMTNETMETSARVAAERQFKQDIKKHINDISTKYLIEHETSDGAVMFIPAEAVFAEIHAHHADLVDLANKQRVWMCSPTTLMAILTTARSVLKDEATRQQVHLIQEHLSLLASDFQRFRGRFDNLARHIDQAASDVKQIHTSANKISTRFDKIEQVDLDKELIE